MRKKESTPEKELDNNIEKKRAKRQKPKKANKTSDGVNNSVEQMNDANGAAEKKSAKKSAKAERKAERKSRLEKAVKDNVKAPSRRTQTAIIVAAAMFALTFVLHFVFGTLVVTDADKITDWSFVTGSVDKSISGDVGSFRQATKENPVTKPFDRNYVRLHYELSAGSDDKILSINTGHAPIKVMIDGNEVLNNGYLTKEFTGNAFESVKISANGNDRTIDIFIYSALGFDFSAKLHSDDSALLEDTYKYVGFGVALALIIIGVTLVVLSLILTASSKNIVRMILLSISVTLGGASSLLYFVLNTTSILTGSFWFGILLVMQMALMVAVFASICACTNESFKKTLVFIPVLVVFAIIPIFMTAWSVRISAAVFAAAQIYIAIKAVRAFSKATSSDVPSVGAICGLCVYAALVNIYNAVSMIIGLSLLNGFLYSFSLTLLCIVLFVLFCKQIIFLDVKKNERLAQIYKDSSWIEDLTDLISAIFVKKEEPEFLKEVARHLSSIIEKNSETDDVIDVHACIGISNGDGFEEIYNYGELKGCDYVSLAKTLDSQPEHLLVGNTTVDMLFESDGHTAIIHFENILCGLYGNIRSIIKAAYTNLYIAYQNLSLKQDMSTIQEELFIRLSDIVESKSSETNKHMIAVSALTYELCRELGMGENRAKIVSTASMAHDIGKIAVPESILTKQGSLTSDEYETMKLHTVYGYNILSVQHGEFFDAASKIALQHHENFDGSGYNGIKGRNISPEARVVHLVDVFEALLSKRSYKEAWSLEETEQYIINGRGTLFDPAVVDAFVRCCDRLYNLRRTIYAEENV